MQALAAAAGAWHEAVYQAKKEALRELEDKHPAPAGHRFRDELVEAVWPCPRIEYRH